MFKLLTRKINNFIRSKLFTNSKDIERMLQEKSLSDTADFIKNNKLYTLQVFNNPYDVLEYSLDQVENKKGLYLEFGVFSGGTINVISSKTPDTTVYGFDSFDGLPEDWRSNFMKGHFKLDALPKVNKNVELIKGWFDTTLPEFLKKNDTSFISFLHVDCDLYSSTKTIFHELGERIHSGTIIVFDEYWNYAGWEDGEYKAFTEFIKESGRKFEYIAYNQRHEQVAVKIV